jgi:hypothetical protein
MALFVLLTYLSSCVRVALSESVMVFVLHLLT